MIRWVKKVKGEVEKTDADTKRAGEYKEDDEEKR